MSLQSKGLSRVFSNTTVQKHQFFGTQLSSVQLSHPYMTTGKTIALTRQTLVGKLMSLLLNMLSRLIITFLPRCKRLLISRPQSPSAVTPIGSQTWASAGHEDPLCLVLHALHDLVPQLTLSFGMLRSYCSDDRSQKRPQGRSVSPQAWGRSCPTNGSLNIPIRPSLDLFLPKGS